jgi:hypothetical protein
MLNAWFILLCVLVPFQGNMFFILLLNLLKFFSKVSVISLQNIEKIADMSFFAPKISIIVDYIFFLLISCIPKAFSYDLSPFPSSFIIFIRLFLWIFFLDLNNNKALRVISLFHHSFHQFLFLSYRNFLNLSHNTFYIIQIFIVKSNFPSKCFSFNFMRLLALLKAIILTFWKVWLFQHFIKS